MSAWTPQDWLVFLGGIGTLIGVIVTGALQIITLIRANQSKAISTDTNQKTTAIVAQTREIARAVPDADTSPTDVVIQRGPATPGAQRATDDDRAGA